MNNSRSTRRSKSTASLEGSSPKTSAFLLSLSGNDIISSSDADTDSDNEKGGLLRLRGRLDTSSEESGSEGSVGRWVSSLGISRRKSPGLLSKAKPAKALRPRARATGGELAAARARTPAAALTALRSTQRGAVSAVRPAAALSAVASAASIDASRPASTATAAHGAAALSASLTAAVPAAAPNAITLATALSALSPAHPQSAVPPPTTAAVSTAHSGSAQADAVQPADADHVAVSDAAATSDVQAAGANAVQPATLGFAQASVYHVAADADATEADVQPAEADPVQLSDLHSVQSGADDAEVGVTQAAETDAAQASSAETTEAAQSAASDTLTVSTAQAHQAKAGSQSASAHQVTNGDVQCPTSGQEFGKGNADSTIPAPEEDCLSHGSLMALASDSTQPNAAAVAPAHMVVDVQIAAPEGEFPSGGLTTLGGVSIQPTADAADQLHTPVGAAAPEKSLSSKFVPDSYWHYEEDLAAGDDFFSPSGPWTETPAPSEAAPNAEPVTAAAAQEAAAPMTEDTEGLDSSAEHVSLAAEGALQLGGLTFGSITSADILGIEQRQHGSKCTAGCASSVVAATAPAVAEVTDEGASVSQQGSSHDDNGRQTEHGSASLHGTEAMVEEEEEGEWHAGLSGHGDEGLDRKDLSEDWQGEEREEAVDTSLDYTAFLTDSLLSRMEQQAGPHGDTIKALGKHCLQLRLEQAACHHCQAHDIFVSLLINDHHGAWVMTYYYMHRLQFQV